MHKLAIILFPGLNTEYETRREINRAGMRGEFFRWNDAPAKLQKYDGYVIGGGFSYEDRGRAGVIASLDPIMKTIKAEAEKGKPVLGICNGAQILVESGLIPGVDGNRLAMALARNKRVKDGEVLGTGYYNTWVHLKCTAPKSSSIFTWNVHEGEMLKAPIAHGEGRFTTDSENLMHTLLERGQIPFRYCDGQGVVTEDFPVNPNGAQFNIAAVCNPAGNVMAIMPHLERDSHASEKLFTSLRDGLDARRRGESKKRVTHLTIKPIKTDLKKMIPEPRTLDFFISLMITDNEAETFEMTLKNLGFDKATLHRATHVSLGYTGKPDLQKTARKLTQSGVLFNTNKEHANTTLPQEKTENVRVRLLVREKQDFIGMSKLSTIQKRLKISEITSVRMGTLWEIYLPTKSKKIAEDELRKMLATNLFFNPHRQEAFLVE